MARTTPERIESLPEGEIFVFGSNVSGDHGGGAALIAQRVFGAVTGVGEGLAGQSYALPTMEGFAALAGAADRFLEVARQHSELTFWLTKVGCGIAGYAEDEVKALFANAPENVIKPPGW